MALIFSRFTFLPWSEVLIVFNISFSRANTSLPNRRFLHEQFLVSKYLILHALLQSESHVLGLQM